MKVYSISDLHMSINNPKPMDIFGSAWEDYLEQIKTDWTAKVQPQDIVLIAGDISWAIKFDDAMTDLEWIDKLPGTKIIIRGNHDYWWKSIGSMREEIPSTIKAVQNDAIKIGNLIICGSRGWTVPEYTHKTADDQKIYNRELIRLEMSLKSAMHLKTDENDKIVVMLHYPPFNSRLEKSDFTDLIGQYDVERVVYGHLHNKETTKHTHLITIDNIPYILTSCDLVDNQLVHIIDFED